MTMVLLAIDLALAAGLIALAGVSLVTRDPNRAVVLFMTFGLLMAFTWARLNAPDIALVEAAIGSGLTGALLLATINASKTSVDSNRAKD